jgi:DDE superfamily endonuclease
VVEPKAGRPFALAASSRSGAEFAQVVCRWAENYPEATTIHLVLDNLNIHRRKPLTDFYGEEAGNQFWDRFTSHDTPRHGSWLNQAEIEISLFSRPCLGKRRIPHRKTLRRETRAWNRRVPRARTKINWQFDRKTARRKFGYKKYFSKRS